MDKYPNKNNNRRSAADLLRNYWYQYVFFVLICLIGTAAGWYVRSYYDSIQPIKTTEIRENDSSYSYINPLLLANIGRQAPEYNSLNKTISDFISSEESNGDASSVSVDFQDLDSGKWTGVNQDKLYDPSSMLKVAMAIGYMKEADVEPSVLTKKINYIATVDPGQNYKPINPLPSGSYAVNDLIKSMIVDSDNAALIDLAKNDSQGFNEVLKDLEINFPTTPPTPTSTDFMSAQTYSKIFRILFNATYLDNAESQEVLQLLTETSFKLGLVAQLPQYITVAHKFGEHTTVVNDVVQSRELHDCGIIYYPGHPYFLCVMTKGADFTKLQSVILNISLMTYQYILKNNPVTGLGSY